jgi:hypothetical protein
VGSLACGLKLRPRNRQHCEIGRDRPDGAGDCVCDTAIIGREVPKSAMGFDISHSRTRNRSYPHKSADLSRHDPLDFAFCHWDNPSPKALPIGITGMRSNHDTILGCGRQSFEHCLGVARVEVGAEQTHPNIDGAAELCADRPNREGR